jgi:hypothetical protein
MRAHNVLCNSYNSRDKPLQLSSCTFYVVVHSYSFENCIAYFHSSKLVYHGTPTPIDVQRILDRKRKRAEYDKQRKLKRKIDSESLTAIFLQERANFLSITATGNKAEWYIKGKIRIFQSIWKILEKNIW